MAKKAKKTTKQAELSPTVEGQLDFFREMIRGCIICNGTGQLCGRCGEAENACRCGGAEEGDLMDCPDCADTAKEENSKRTTLKNPCNECPFRKAAAPGWIGSHSSTKEIIQISQNDQHFPCHLTINYEKHNWKEEAEKAPHCVGALVFMNHCAKLSRNPEIAELQNQVGKRDDVFKTSAEMKNHHRK